MIYERNWVNRSGFNILGIILAIAVLSGVTVFSVKNKISSDNAPVAQTQEESKDDSFDNSVDNKDSDERNSVSEENKDENEKNLTSNSDTKTEVADSGKREVITFAGGCFWCIEAFFQEESGVVGAINGYAGGDSEDATYLIVSKGKTEHREVVQVTFDPERVSLERIIDIFWTQINPTDDSGQFADRGFQYTTAIFYHNDNQKSLAEASKKRLEESGLFDKPIVTKIIPYSTFFEAEEYHQDYYKKASEHYQRYAKASGRKGFIEENWAKSAAIEFLENQQKEESKKVQLKGDYNYTPEEIEELLKNLDPLAYHIVAEGGTESPFNNAYWDNKSDGIYVDVVTGEALFSSTHKYDSGTGWPSFWRSIDDESITLQDDNSLLQTRTEVRSDSGHLGHVFNDGPIEQGGRRFCINSASLLFIPKAEMEKKGYGEYLKLFEK